MQKDKAHYTILMGDFNAKVGCRQDDAEFSIGSFVYGQRNNRGSMLLYFLLHHKLYLMNSFFKKNKNRKLTWISPDGTTKNEIDFITTNRKNIVQDVTVIKGTDHRLVR